MLTSACIHPLSGHIFGLDICRSGGGQQPLLVSLLDGTVAALDVETGDVLWRLDLGSPLLASFSAALRPGSNSLRAEEALMHSGLPIMLPGADGSLFITWGDATSLLERGLEVRLCFERRSQELVPSMQRCTFLSSLLHRKTEPPSCTVRLHLGCTAVLQPETCCSTLAAGQIC